MKVLRITVFTFLALLPCQAQHGNLGGLGPEREKIRSLVSKVPSQQELTRLENVLGQGETAAKAQE